MLVIKDDLKRVENTIAEVIKENQYLKEELRHIKEQNALLWDRLENIENRSLRNNLVFKGLQFNNDKDLKTTVKIFCAGYLATGKKLRINRAHILGARGNNRLIIAHILNDHLDPYND